MRRPANKPPTPIEQRDLLVKNISYQIVSHLVNTSEQVPLSWPLAPAWTKLTS